MFYVPEVHAEKTELEGTYVKSRVREGHRVLGARKSEMSCKDVGDGIKDRVVVPTVLYGAESSGVNAEEKNRLNVFEMQCL